MDAGDMGGKNVVGVGGTGPGKIKEVGGGSGIGVGRVVEGKSQE